MGIGANGPDYSKLDQSQIIQRVFDETEDRLRTDAQVSVVIGNLDVEVSAADGDTIAISDGVNTAQVTPTGNLQVQVMNAMDIEVSASDGDNIAISDGTNTAQVTPAGELKVAAVDLDIRNLDSLQDSVSVPGVATELKQDDIITELQAVNTTLTSIDNGIPSSLGQTTSNNSMPVVLATDQPSIPVNAVDLDIRNLDSSQDSVSVPGVATETKQDAANSLLSSIDTKLTAPLTINGSVSLTDEPIKMSGTENGQPNGTEFTFVNNLRLQILNAKDRIQNITYADFGTKDQRITQIDYLAPSIGTGVGYTARKSLSYTLVGTKYRRDSINWNLV